jgi:DNA polymerase III alpha subunit
MIAIDEKESKIIEIIHMIQDTIGNELLLALGDKESIGCVVNNNYFYPSQGEKQAREVALAIKDGMKIYDENRRKPKGQFHIMSEEEIIEILEHNGLDKHTISQMIENNNTIAE